MNSDKIFDTIDGLFSFISEQDEGENDYDGDGNDFPDKDDGSDSEFISGFSNRFEMIADRLGGVVSFIKDDDKDAALVSLEKIIEDIIKSYYEMGGEGDVLKGIRGNTSSDGQNKEKDKKPKKKKPKKKKKEKEKEKEKEKGDEGQDVDQGEDGEKKEQDIGESVYDSAIFNKGKDLSEIDVGYSIKEKERELSLTRVLKEGKGSGDPFGFGDDFMGDIKRRSGVK